MWFRKKRGPEGFESCGTCHFWAGGPALLHDSGASAMCRRFPPSPVLENERITQGDVLKVTWPWTGNMDYCGEYAPRRGLGLGA